jgi:hypothetical protein
LTPEAWRRVTRTGARVAANAALRATAFILSMCLGGCEGVEWRMKDVVLQLQACGCDHQAAACSSGTAERKQPTVLRIWLRFGETKGTLILCLTHHNIRQHLACYVRPRRNGVYILELDIFRLKSYGTYQYTTRYSGKDGSTKRFLAWMELDRYLQLYAVTLDVGHGTPC